MIWDISSDERIKQVINQASKSWVMPTDISIDIYGIGEPVYKIGEPTGAHDGDYYFDVANGKIYKFIIEITNNSDGSTSYKPYWNLEETLTSVQDELTNKYILQTFTGTTTQVKNTSGAPVSYTLPYTTPQGYEVAQITAFGGSSYVSASINNIANNYIYMNLSNSDTTNWQTCTPYAKILFKKIS